MPRLNGTGPSCPATATPELRAATDSPPGRLGLAHASEPFNEQSWDTFWGLDPNRRPAHYASARRVGEVSDDPRVQHFDCAHHQALLFGLSFRIADRPFMRSSRFSSLRDSLLHAWVDALAGACGDRPLARQAVERALSLLRAGTQLEASAFRTWRLAPGTYAEQTRLKLRWRSATPRVLLQQSQGEARAADFERCYDLFGMSVQCLIDAMDAEEGAALRGVSVPRLLGLADSALVEAAVVLVERAAERAAHVGFGALCEWLARFDRFLRDAQLEGHRSRFGSEGRALGEMLAREL
jgi:hypothetical protein